MPLAVIIEIGGHYDGSGSPVALLHLIACSSELPPLPPSQLGVDYGAWHQKTVQLAAAQSADCITTKAGGGIVAVTQVFGVSFICRDARRSTAFTCVVSCDFPCIL